MMKVESISKDKTAWSSSKMVSTENHILPTGIT